MGAKTIRRTMIAAAVVGLLATGTALAQPYGPGYGPGMMGGWGPGGGPGMMMGGGWGPGGGGGFGPGGGMGPGMGYGMLAQLNLTAEQCDKVAAIQDQASKKQWEITGRMSEETAKMRGLMQAESRDRNAINSQYKKMQDLRQQRFQARLETQEKIDAVLTKEQKAQRRRFGPWWAQEVVE